RSIGRGFITTSDLIQEDSWIFDTLGSNSLAFNGSSLLSKSAAAELPSEPSESGSQSALSMELHYYVPCVMRDRMVAIIGVGRTATGALLTSEDTDLLRALSGYVAVAIDNSLLYRSELEKAQELSRLKEFSENIIESVNVGILVVDTDGRITTWNSALEEMMG